MTKFSNSRKCILKNVSLIACILFSFKISFAQSIKIFNLEGIPVEGVLGVSEKIYLIGVSDSAGCIKYSSSFEGENVILKKLGYRDTSIRLTDGNQIHMHLSSFQLAEVDIPAPRIDPSQILKQFVAYNIPLMSQKRDTIQMEFSCEISIPSKSWTENRSGRLMLIYNSYNKKATGVWNSTYCDLEVKVDSSFWHSPLNKELIEGTIIGSFEKDGMRRNRLLRKNQFNDHKVYRSKREQDYEFDLSSIKNERLDLSKVGFREDSTISYFSYQWLNETKETQAAGVMNAKINSQYSYLKYSENKPFTVDSIYSKVGFINKKGILHEIIFKAKKLVQKDSSNCLDLSIFLKFNPEVFKNLGIEEKVQYLK